MLETLDRKIHMDLITFEMINPSNRECDLHNLVIHI